MRIYVSAMETEVEGLPRFDPQAATLLERLSAIGYVVVWEKQHRGYDVIEKDIAASDALLAIVDTTWFSSTWMAIEVTYANGMGGSGLTTNPPMMPIPVLLYPVAPDISLPSLYGMCETMPLVRDVEKAIVQIMEKLPLRTEGE